MKVLHIANWYPNPWSAIEGNFIRDQIRLFTKEVPGQAVVVKVRHDRDFLLRPRILDLGEGVTGYFVLTRLSEGGRAAAWLTTILLLWVLIKYQAWRYSALHFHIANPLLRNVSLWSWFVRRPILISEHWSAYHDNFYLPSDSPALAPLRRPFAHRFPVLAVSNALLNDIRKFSGRDDFPAHVIPNIVPLHGTSQNTTEPPLLFAVNNWVAIKDPFPMLEGLASAAADGHEFSLVIGGAGPLIERMEAFVQGSALAGRTNFLGWMTKVEISEELAKANGYLFSSRYETFSIACAEALGAGVPLIGPRLEAIAEYAGPDEWVQVSNRDENNWADAVVGFLQRNKAAEFDPAAIAARAEKQFNPSVIRQRYREAISQTLSEDVQ